MSPLVGLLWWLRIDLIINSDAFDGNCGLYLQSLDCTTVFACIQYFFNWTNA